MAICAPYSEFVEGGGEVNAFVNSRSLMHTFFGMVNTSMNQTAQFPFVNTRMLK
jgi:hypothetical protein